MPEGDYKRKGSTIFLQQFHNAVSTHRMPAVKLLRKTSKIKLNETKYVTTEVPENRRHLQGRHRGAQG